MIWCLTCQSLRKIKNTTLIYCTAVLISKITLFKQLAQLSQTDRAAGWVIVMIKSRRLELGDNIYGHYRSPLNHCDVIGQKSNRIR